MIAKRKHLLTVLAAIMLIITMTSGVFTVINDGFGLYLLISSILEIGLGVTAFVYIINDFSKKYAISYKLFFILCIVTYIFEWALSGEPTNAIDNVANLLGYSAYVVLAFATDLGRRKSLIAAYIPLIIDFTFAIYYAVTFMSNHSEVNSFSMLLGYIAIISSDILTVIMVYGKFSDKAQRKGIDADK